MSSPSPRLCGGNKLSMMVPGSIPGSIGKPSACPALEHASPVSGASAVAWPVSQAPSTVSPHSGLPDGASSSFPSSSSSKRSPLSQFFGRFLGKDKKVAESHADPISTGFLGTGLRNLAESEALKRPMGLPEKTAQERADAAEAVQAMRKDFQRTAKKRQALQAQARRRAERIETFLQAAQQTWESEILPNWPASATRRSTQQVWRRYGLPEALRKRVWPLAIGNELQLTPELFEVLRTPPECLQGLQGRVKCSRISTPPREIPRSTGQPPSLSSSEEHCSADLPRASFVVSRRQSMSASVEDKILGPIGVHDESLSADTTTELDDSSILYDTAPLSAPDDTLRPVRDCPAECSATEAPGVPTSTSSAHESPPLSISPLSPARLDAFSTGQSDSSSEGEDVVPGAVSPYEGAAGTSSEDKDVPRPSTAASLIVLDLHRTFPSLQFFQEGQDHDNLFVVLDTYVRYNPSVGYVQGMSYLAATLLLYLDCCTAFVCMANLLQKYHFLAFFQMQPKVINSHLLTFDMLLRDQLPDLHRHLKLLNIRAEFFCIDWFVTLFSKSIPLDVAMRLWDLFFLDSGYLYRGALAILSYFGPILLQSGFDEALELLTHLPPQWDVAEFFHHLHRLHVSRKKIRAVFAHAQRIAPDRFG
eukprot:RCo043067